MRPNEKQKIEIEKLQRDPLSLLNQAVTADYSDFLGTALDSNKQFEGPLCRRAKKKQPKKGERPVGVPAARGHGVMEVQKLEVPAAGPAAPKVALQSLLLGAAQCPESFSMMPGRVCPVDSPVGSFIPSTNVPPRLFASFPLTSLAERFC